ncbi:chemotaxis protein CheA [Candidatus Parabeggiatoa sp. HSG14]|uniref:chemotaxis protein CheA n=1 Tax=Candidatus Parabeggiatoa sp. HSG14 TaxID=3055593 RepID=UPI0025A8187C|nr:chemotaxis protein CheA [Thiotrichales bacterium HSG14]
MAVDLTEIRELFIEESLENLDVMESNLLDLEIGTLDKELINSIFRAAHSIKGGAGIFKFEKIVTFAHAAETLLDEMRNGEHLITQPLIDVLLCAGDMMRMMISALQDDKEYDVQKVQACQNELQKNLKTPIENAQADYDVSPPTMPEASENGQTEHKVSLPTTPEVSSPLPETTIPPSSKELPINETLPTISKGWHIVFKPALSMLKTGNDPIYLFRELARLGDLEVKTDSSQLPTFEDIDPQLCYLSWELTLYGDIERAAIDEIFEWVEDECELHITALEPSAQRVEKIPLSKEEKLDFDTEIAFKQEEELQLDKENFFEKQGKIPFNGEDIILKKEEEILLDKVEEFEKPEGEISKSVPLQNEKTLEKEEITPVKSSESVKEAFLAEAEITKGVAKETSIPDEKIISPSSLKISAKEETVRTKQGSGKNHTHHTIESNSIRVSIDKIDNLINMVGELVITQSMLDQVGEGFDNSQMSQLRDGLGQLERNTRELQESVMRIRMLPISFSFNRFPRLVHDLSEQLGKKIELKLSGENTELDKTVLEKMSDPLVHLVRNALDHGVEIPEQRRAAGKPETGLLHLHAFHQGGNIIISISDDGAGFDLKKIRDKAIQKGLATLDEYLSEEQLHEFIFQPGFSTVTQVSDVSGRGVGMDVVRRNIRALGGTIEVKSKYGQGSTFNIRLPLTLAILDGQLVRVGEDIYILPLLSIIESLRVKIELVSSFASRAEVYRLRDEYIPILRLYTLFNITAATNQLDQGLLVIVEGDGQKIGLFVDELLSQQQIVIKSLESNFKKVEGVSGATILGDGSVALILDVAGLIHLFHNQTKLPIMRIRSNL